MADFEKHCKEMSKINNKPIKFYNNLINEIELPEDSEKLYNKIKYFIEKQKYENDVLPSFRQIETEEKLDGLSKWLDNINKELIKIKDDFDNIKEKKQEYINYVNKRFVVLEYYLIAIIILLIVLIFK